MLIANILGVFIFFYLLWRTLKEDYSYEKIFNLSFLIILGALLASLILLYLKTSFWFWILLLASFSGFLIGILKQKMKFFETFEGFVIGILPWIGLVFISDAIKNSSLSSFLAFWAILILVFLYFFLNSFYRTFTWYKSGRFGFSGVFVAIVFFIIRAASSLFFPSVISFAGKFEVYLSGSAALLLMVLLYNLARKEE